MLCRIYISVPVTTGVTRYTERVLTNHGVEYTTFRQLWMQINNKTNWQAACNATSVTLVHSIYSANFFYWQVSDFLHHTSQLQLNLTLKLWSNQHNYSCLRNVLLLRKKNHHSSVQILQLKYIQRKIKWKLNYDWINWIILLRKESTFECSNI